MKAIFHWAEFSTRSDIFFGLETNWQSTSRRQKRKEKKMSFPVENSAQWKTALGQLNTLSKQFAEKLDWIACVLPAAPLKYPKYRSQMSVIGMWLVSFCREPKA